MANLEFPEFPELKEDNFIPFQSHIFLESIEKIFFSIANEQENIYSLTSVLLEKQKINDSNYFKFVSSDGHRLSIMEKEIPNDVESILLSDITLLPKRGVQELKKYCETRDNFFISFEEKQLIIKDESSIMFIRLKKGEFPNYSAILESINLDSSFLVKRLPLLDALKRINIFTEDIYHTIKVMLSTNLMVVTSQNSELGNAKDQIECSYTGEQMVLGFNCRYFIETLQVMNGEYVELFITSESNPCLIKSNEDEGFLSIIMPMQL
jgi:DNA polymerase-3 subunit beta